MKTLLVFLLLASSAKAGIIWQTPVNNYYGGYDYYQPPMQRMTIYGGGQIQTYRFQQEPSYGYGQSYRVYGPNGGLYRVRSW